MCLTSTVSFLELSASLPNSRATFFYHRSPQSEVCNSPVSFRLRDPDLFKRVILFVSPYAMAFDPSLCQTQAKLMHERSSFTFSSPLAPFCVFSVSIRKPFVPSAHFEALLSLSSVAVSVVFVLDACKLSSPFFSPVNEISRAVPLSLISFGQEGSKV